MQDLQNLVIVHKKQTYPDQILPQLYQEIELHIKTEQIPSNIHKATLGMKYFHPHLQQIILQMRKNQLWVLKDRNGSQYEIRLVNLFAINDHRSHLVIAESLKLQGNANIKKKQYQLAIQNYQKSYNLIINDPSPQAYELKLSLISNLALATSNINEFQSSLKWCNQHLQQTLQPNLKVIYRRSNAHRGLRNWAEAKKDIEFGITHSGQDKDSIENFKKLLIQLQKQQKEQQKKQKALYGKMFG